MSEAVEDYAKIVATRRCTPSQLGADGADRFEAVEVYVRAVFHTARGPRRVAATTPRGRLPRGEAHVGVRDVKKLAVGKVRSNTPPTPTD